MIGNKFLSVAGASEPTDAQFNYVTMLLRGDGTNGAQNNTFLDSSTNNFTITRNGNTTQGTFSPYGNLWSNYFGGSGTFLAIPSSSEFQFGTGDFTIEGWVYLSTYNSLTTVFANCSNQGGETGLALFISSTGQLRMFSYISVAYVADGGTVPLNQWVHIAATRAGTNLRLFINGVLSVTASNSQNFIGNASQGGVGGFVGNNSGAFTGYLSGLRVVKGTAVYTATFTPSTTPLAAISGTSLLTCQSNRFKDSSNNAFAITPTGTPSVQRFSPFNPTVPYSAATIGGSGYFDGTGDYLSTTGSFSFTGDFTVEGWMYATATGARPFGKGDVALTSGISCYCTTTTFEVTLGTSLLIAPTYPILNQWIHYAVVRSGSTCTVYLNGVSQGSGSYSGTVSGTTYIGAANYSATVYETSKCYLADSRFANTAIYSGNFTPPTAPLTAASGTQVLVKMTNAGIPDNAMMNDLETVGNAQVSTSVKKYGTGSMYFDGTPSYLTTPYNPIFDFGTGDFTIETWYYPTDLTSATADNWIISRSPSNNTTAFGLSVSPAGYVQWFGASFSSPAITSSNTLSINNWYHVAISRSNGTTYMFVNGTQVGSTASSYNITTGSTPTFIACASFGQTSSRAVRGYIDDLRITKGYARYTTNFTPPAQALPNKGS